MTARHSPLDAVPWFIFTRFVVDRSEPETQVVEMDQHVHPRVQVERTVGPILVGGLPREQLGVSGVVQREFHIVPC